MVGVVTFLYPCGGCLCRTLVLVPLSLTAHKASALLASCRWSSILACSLSRKSCSNNKQGGGSASRANISSIRAETFCVPQCRFDHINVDKVGPLPPSASYTHLLITVDHFTRWPEAIPLSDTSAFACAQALFTHWIAHFGVTMDMSSDRGSQFTSYLWDSISQLLGTKPHHTTAYHPQSNGLVERFRHHLKSAL